MCFFFLISLLYRLSATPLMYPASLVFDIPSSAFVGLACGNLFIGVITTISSFVLQLFDDEVRNRKKIGTNSTYNFLS